MSSVFESCVTISASIVPLQEISILLASASNDALERSNTPNTDNFPFTVISFTDISSIIAVWTVTVLVLISSMDNPEESMVATCIKSVLLSRI